MRMKESEFTRKKIRPYLESLGARVVKYHGSAMNESGVADLLVCFPPAGRFVAIEVKMAGEQPRPNQVAFLESIRKAGGLAVFAHSDTWREDVDKIIGLSP